MTDDSKGRKRPGFLRAIGPAIITASVVLGPGSILSASKMGFLYGYSMIWILAIAVVMMIGVTALSARLGVLFPTTPCSELARRAGRPFAAITGISLFLIASCFQFGNNLGVSAAIKPFLSGMSQAGVAWASSGLIAALNVLVIIALFGFRQLYQPVERLMKTLVTLMIIGFAANLIMARPEFSQVLSGLRPRLPEGALATVFPRIEKTTNDDGEVKQRVVDNMTPVIAMFATTFSIAAAFYQAYLVRKKGWTVKDLRQGTIDSAVGICVLGLVTAMIMLTAASVLHNKPDVSLTTVADVADELRPMFGEAATILFCVGIFAGAFSSFLVNAMIGGTVLSDGLGLGGDIDAVWPKCFTVLALMIGLAVAVFVIFSNQSPLNLIVFAQAITVLGFPALALAMCFLATRRDLPGGAVVPLWMKAFAFTALIIAFYLAARTALSLYYRWLLQS